MINNNETKIEKLTNNNNHDFDILYTENICIICWEINAKIILCLNCKFKYCDSCVKKIDRKCCICFRNKENKYIDNYDIFYSDNFQITYNPHFNTYFLTIISSLIIFICSCIGIIFLFKILFNSFFDFINQYLLILLF